MEYCSGRLWEVDEGVWTLGPKMGRFLSGTAFTSTELADASSKRGHIINNCYAMRYTGWYVPGVREYALGHMSACLAADKYIKGEVNAEDAIKYLSDQTQHVVKIASKSTLVSKEPTKHVKQQFYHIYGVTAEEMSMRMNQLVRRFKT